MLGMARKRILGVDPVFSSSELAAGGFTRGSNWALAAFDSGLSWLCWGAWGGIMIGAGEKRGRGTGASSLCGEVQATALFLA